MEFEEQPNSLKCDIFPTVERVKRTGFLEAFLYLYRDVAKWLRRRPAKP